MEAELPANLHDAILYFANPDLAQDFVAEIRWPKGPECPTCGSKDLYHLTLQRRWKCKNRHPKQQFSVKIGTIFEDSPVGLDKWLPAVWLVTNCKNDVSSYEIARDLGVTQKTAWFMMHRIRLAMKASSFETKLTGEVEADETFVDGKTQNMHKKRRIRAHQKDNWAKTVVLGLLEREGGEVRAAVAPSRRRPHLEPHLISNLERSVKLYTDDHPALQVQREASGLSA